MKRELNRKQIWTKSEQTPADRTTDRTWINIKSWEKQKDPMTRKTARRRGGCIAWPL